MTDQPPVRPPLQPSGRPAEGDPAPPATRPMPAAAPPQAPPTANVWRQATSTTGGRWAIGVAAGAVACLMLLGLVVAGMVVLRAHDRFDMLGQRGDGYSRDQGELGRRGDGRGPGARDGLPRQRGMPGAPGMRGGQGQGQGGHGGLGNLLGGTALHGNVSAKVDGSVQALAFQRGEVTAVSATSLTLRSSDGFAGTYRLTAATSSRGAAPAKGGQAFVLARASDKVALRFISTPVSADVPPSR